MGIKSKTHFHTPITSRWWKCAWLEQATRVAPLAARPAKRLSTVCFALLLTRFPSSVGKMLALARSSTLDSRRNTLILPKRKTHRVGCVCLFGAGERGRSLHTSTGIKTHIFTHFSGISGCLWVFFYALPDCL